MAYGKKTRGKQMASGGKSIGDGYTPTSLKKTFGGEGKANVVGSRLNKGGDSAYKGKRHSVKHS